MRHIMITSGYYDAQWRKYETGGSLNVQSLLKIALTLDTPLGELLDGLSQWPRLSVEEIEKKSGVASDSPKPAAETLPSLQAKQGSSDEPATRTKAFMRGVKKSSDTTPPGTKAAVRSAPASE
ncbi:MAG: hypothetical protein ACRYFU_21245 [Janthinobacterium lividum]